MGGMGSGRGENTATRIQLLTAAKVSKDLFNCWSEIVSLIDENYRKGDDTVITCRSKSAMFYLQNALRLAADTREQIKNEINATRMGVLPTLVNNHNRAARQTAASAKVASKKKPLKQAPLKKR